MKRLGALVFVVGALAFGSSCFASSAFLNTLQLITRAASDGGLNWKVGDTLNYKMIIKPLPITGTTTISVTGDTADGYWLTQDVFFKSFKQESKVLLDKDTGQIKKMLVNGREQAPPSSSGQNIEKIEQAHITVPGGAYDCIHIVVDDSSQNVTEQWVNPRDLPITGMVKSVSTAGGVFEVDTELTSFVRGK